MSDETPRLKLAQLVSMQEMNDVTWNEALAQLDALVDLCLLGQYVNAPPANPQDGDAYLVGAAPTGAWSGYAYKIASCLDGAWRFYTPFNGLRAYVTATGALIAYLGGQWVDWNSLISANEVSIASASACDLGAAGSLFVQITGTTAITSFGTAANRLRFVRFAGALTLTHNAASLILLGGASRTTAAGDVGIYASDASGNWRERSYFRSATNAGDTATKSGTETLSNKTFSGVTNFPNGTVINESGYVGINTTPSTSFEIKSNSVRLTDATGKEILNLAPGASLCSIYTDYFGGAGGAEIPLSIGTLTNRLSQIYCTTDGKVGIMTNGPRAALDVAGSIYPHTDNACNLGSASYRFGTVYAATGTINTSGAAAKTGARALSAAEMAVAKALATNIRVFQFVDAVARKGEDAARLHLGMIFEDVVAAFAAEGLDPMRYGIVCRDPVFKQTAVTTTPRVPVMKTEQAPVESFVSLNGRSVLTVTTQERQVQDYDDEPVVDAAGNPVIGPDGLQRLNRVFKFAPGTPVTDYVETTEQDVDDEGNPKWRLGLRYGELAQFLLAGLAGRLAAGQP